MRANRKALITEHNRIQHYKVDSDHCSSRLALMLAKLRVFNARLAILKTTKLRDNLQTYWRNNGIKSKKG